ncbi:MAG: amylo-alpha-1,6-glucosidase [Salinibacterium sp.]|nr:amylo-alpha-1,6-glucosidase [Salinibacterium sp.]
MDTRPSTEHTLLQPSVEAAERPLLQPLLHNEMVVLRAPTQVWSAADGSIGSQPIHGIYFSDVRIVSSQVISVAGAPLEHLATVPRGADSLAFVSLARQLDDTTPDPGVRAEHLRTATITGVDERLEITSRLDQELIAVVRVDYVADATGMDSIKSGAGPTGSPLVSMGDGLTTGALWNGDSVSVDLMARGASITADSISWIVTVPARGSVSVAWSYNATDELAVVRGSAEPAPWVVPALQAGDDRLGRWASRALDDLDTLRLTTADRPDQQFLAAGAPWFFTLFGRDSIWAARFMLPPGTRIAADTLRVLAGLQGAAKVDDTAEEPGKIMHELRRIDLVMPGEGIHLPPLYYGTVDSTALWICLLYDAWKWGMPEDEVRALLPNLERALEWMRDFGDSDGDGLLEYADKSGRGLSNQGWKDSGDSVQWRDGSLAAGPIALVEVQAYAYEAAVHGADLLDAFGTDGTPWREWGARLRTAFHEKFWIEDADGAYLAIALDATKKPVDTVTSNVGHVLGTGILDQRQAALVAARLVAPALNSGFGLRTMSTDSAGYWPLSYHGGSVWTHDTAIAIAGLAREGFRNEADELTRGLLAAASGFDYRMPELHSGDAASDFARPVPYAAACRPQAWSAASAISVLSSVLGLVPDAPAGTLGIAPTGVVGGINLNGIVFAGVEGGVSVNAAGEVTGGTLPFVVG